MVGTFGSAISQWYIVWLFARQSGATVVGEYSSLLAIITPIFIVGQFGLRTLYLTLQSRSSWATFFLLRVFGIILAAGAFVTYLVWAQTDVLFLGIALLSLKIVDSVGDLLYARIQRSNRLALFGTLALSNSVVTIVATTVTVLLTGSIVGAVLASACVSGVTALTSWCFVRVLKPDSGSTGRNIKPIISAAIPVTIAQGLAAWATYLPVQLLTMWASAEVVGVYASIAYLLTATNLLGSSLQTILVTPLRYIFELGGKAKMLIKGLRYSATSIGIGLPLIPIVGFAGQAVIHFIYGPEFSVNLSVLFVLGLTAIAIVPSYILGTVLSILNRYSGYAVIYLVSVSLGILFGYLTFIADVEPLLAAGVVALSSTWARLLGTLFLVIITLHRERTGSS